MTRALFDALFAEGSTSRVVVDDGARTLDAATLLAESARRARALANAPTAKGARVAIVVEPGADWLTWTLAVWRAGGVAVPLLVDQPLPEIAHALSEARVDVVVTTTKERARLGETLAAVRVLDARAEAAPANDVEVAASARPILDDEEAALVLFTSGTTGRPKAAALSHRALDAQLRSLAGAWAWSARDHALLVLPLHHVHGIVNVLFSSMAAGAKVTMLHPFDAGRTLDRLVQGDVNVFMAVPTIYKRLLDATQARSDDGRAAIARAFSSMRLVVSGSAALDVPTFGRIRDVFGVVPLERYGMTEIGMALSNPLEGERVAGTVGFPLPTVSVRLVDEAGHALAGGFADDEAPVEGDIEVRGPTLFSGYLFRDDVTRASFTDDGWFRTGDFARRRAGRYAILGRRSSDILKTGGEKVSALEIEGAILAHVDVRACAVVGLPHEEWGQEVCAVVEVAPGVAPPTLSALRATLKRVLAPFKVPRRLFVTDALPVNALGKVQKSLVVARARAATDDDAQAAHGVREVRP